MFGPFLLLVLALIQAPSQAQSPPADPDEEALVRALRERDQRMSVAVTIDGRGPYRFLVDTGAQATVVSKEIAEELALASAGTATLMGLAGSSPVATVELDRLAFAGREINGLVAPVLERENIGAQGIIGLDSLQDLRVTIDLRDDVLAVAPSPARAADRSYEIIVRARVKKGQMIITRATIDGIRTAVIVDTGSQASLGNPALLSRLRVRGRAKVMSIDVNGARLEGEAGIAHRLAIDRVSMNDIPITFADSPVFAALGLDERPALILGMRNLRLFDRVAIDFARQQILFDVPASTPTR